MGGNARGGGRFRRQAKMAGTDADHVGRVGRYVHVHVYVWHVCMCGVRNVALFATGALAERPAL